MTISPVLTADAVQALIRAGLPLAADLRVEWVKPGAACVYFPYSTQMLRPGGVLSGPTLMAAADSAMYAAVLAHTGPQLMAVTADMNLRFLNKANAEDIFAEAHILKMGRKLIVMECRVWTVNHAHKIAMHATGSYVLPG